MPDRDDALRTLRARIAWVRENDDLPQVMRPEAALDAARLAAETVLSEDLEAATQLGWYHWLRSRALGGAGAGDVVVAARLLGPVLRARPDADVPAQIAAAFRESADNPAWVVTGRAASLTTQGIYLVRAYERAGHLPALLSGIDMLRTALESTPPADREHAARTTNLAAAVRMLADRVEDAPSLAEAVELGRHAADAAPPGHPHHAPVHYNLAAALSGLARETGDDDLMREAVPAARAAVAATTRDEQEWPGRLDMLGGILAQLGVWTSRRVPLEEGVATALEAVRAAPPDHPDRPRFLTNLASGMRALGELDDSVELLREAADLGARSVRESPRRVPYRVPRMIASAAHWRVLAERAREPAAAEKGVAIARGAVAEAAEDPVRRYPALSELALCLQVLYELTEDPAVLAEAVDTARAAAERVVPDPAMRSVQLANLSTVLRHLFVCTGRREFLEEAITHLRAVIDVTPGAHPHRTDYLSELSVALRLLAQRTGQLEAIVISVRIAREVLEDTSTRPEVRTVREYQLAQSLLTLYRRTEETPLLEECVTLGRRVVEETPRDQTVHADYVTHLVLSLLELHQSAPAVELLDEAESLARGARTVPAAPPSLQAHVHSALAEVLVRRATATGEPQHAAEALRMARIARDLVPVENAGHAEAQEHVATIARLVFDQSGDVATLAEAHTCFQRAAEATTSRPLRRIQAYRAWAALPPLEASPDSFRLTALEQAVTLVPGAVATGPNPDDRHHAARYLSGLAAEAAGAALAAGDPRRAVELLEATRGVLAPTFAATPELERLRAVDRALAEEFLKLSDRLAALDREVAGQTLTLSESKASPAFSAAARTTRYVLGAEAVGAARSEAYEAWDDIVTRIRALPGMHDFLRPRIEALTVQAAEGPVVLLVALQDDGAGLILTGDTAEPVRLVPLAGLSSEESHERAMRFSLARYTARDREATLPARRAAQADLREVLAWLWDVVVEPVLLALGHRGSPPEGEELSRVWWCPVGILNHLPLHAAGHHTAKDGRATLDRVVSSHTSTVQTLAQARERQAMPGSEAPGSVVVATEAGGDGLLPSLPGAPAEARAVADRVPDALLLDRPSRDQLLAALPTHAIAHFACHGRSDWAAPTRSSLLLRDHDSHPMTLEAIRSLRLRHARLAYLSACETALTHPLLADEALHLTAGFQLAGYQQVIGTLWPIGDKAALDIARAVYDHLTDHGARPPDPAQSAHALHHATRALRDRAPNTPSAWAAHIHTGV